MPIYAYRCESCGHAKDVLQKVSDAPLSVCPQCGEASFRKQVTAAGFQLKGSGWYVTDFRNNNGGAAPAKKDGADAPAAAKEGDGAKDASPAKSTDAPAKSEAAAPTPAPASSSSTPSSGSGS